MNENLKWHRIDKGEIPTDGSVVQVRCIILRDDTDDDKYNSDYHNNPDNYTYENAWYIEYYTCQFFLTDKMRRTGKFIVSVPFNTTAELNARMNIAGFDSFGDYLLYDIGLDLPPRVTCRHLQWRYIVEEDGNETQYSFIM